MVSAVLIGSIGAPAATAAPKDIQGNVTVVNDETSPIPVTIQNGGATIVEYRYIGTTTATTDGSAVSTTPSGANLSGVAALHRMCAIEYGEEHPGVRAASVSEATYATDPLPPVPAWVVATDLSAVTAGSTWIAIDGFTGRAASSNRASERSAVLSSNCGNYSTTQFDLGGPVMLVDAQDGTRGCSETLPVACAAPRVISVGQ